MSDGCYDLMCDAACAVVGHLRFLAAMKAHSLTPCCGGEPTALTKLQLRLFSLHRPPHLLSACSLTSIAEQLAVFISLFCPASLLLLARSLTSIAEQHHSVRTTRMDGVQVKRLGCANLLQCPGCGRSTVDVGFQQEPCR